MATAREKLRYSEQLVCLTLTLCNVHRLEVCKLIFFFQFQDHRTAKAQAKPENVQLTRHTAHILGAAKHHVTTWRQHYSPLSMAFFFYFTIAKRKLFFFHGIWIEENCRRKKIIIKIVFHAVHYALVCDFALCHIVEANVESLLSDWLKDRRHAELKFIEHLSSQNSARGAIRYAILCFISLFFSFFLHSWSTRFSCVCIGFIYYI